MYLYSNLIIISNVINIYQILRGKVQQLYGKNILLYTQRFEFQTHDSKTLFPTLL
jgi:GH25 family lysozyme M1 (1,4-beta-N-acetylmuramidase)